MSQQQQQPQNDDKLVALGRVLQTLREEENADVLIETTLDYLSREFNYPLTWIGLYDRLEHRLFGKGGITPTGEIAFLKQWFNLNPGDLLEQVVIQQRPIGIPDLRQEIRAGEWRRAAEEFGIQGTLLFPLRCKDRCFGVVLLGSQLWGMSPHPAEKAQLSSLLGGLAAALYQIEVNWQYSSLKRPDQPLFQVLNELIQAPTLAQRLEKVVTITQQFIVPTRTNIYWYSSEGRYFWHRVGNRPPIPSLGRSRTNVSGLTVAEVHDFYQALAAGQLVAIGAGRSLLKSSSTQRLLGRLRTRSLLAAPIQIQGELLGFLAVEDSEARIWEEAERNYVRAMAQLVGLGAGTEELEKILAETQKNANFTAEIAQAIARSSDTIAALKSCARLLCTRLDAERFFVLQEEGNGEFTILCSTQPLNRRPLSSSLPPLSSSDQQWLFNSTDAIAIEDLDADWRLVQWRKSFSAAGVRSALLAPLGQPLPIYQASEIDHYSQSALSQRSSLLLVTHGTPRTWNRTQRELVNIVAQQLNLLLLLANYTESARLSFFARQTLQSGLSTLFQAPLDPIQLEHIWLNYLATLLECPLVALISWTPGSELATVAATVVSDSHFALPPDLMIPVATDALVQDAIATSTFVCRSVSDLAASTRQWLNSPGIGQLLIIALHSSATPTTGIVLLADHEQRQWPRHLLSPLETLTQQFSWLRHYQRSLNRHVQENENLQKLNWYKHRCLEMLHQSVRDSIGAIMALETKAPLSIGSEGGHRSLANPETEIETLSTGSPMLQQMHRKQLLRQLEQTLAVLTPVLKEEQWQLSVKLRPVSLAGLLKRLLRQVEPLYHQHQRVLQVHNSSSKNVYGDLVKLESVLFELLVTACFHAQPGSRINLWCCPINPELQLTLGSRFSRPLLELLIADSSLLDECLHAVTTSRAKLPPTVNLKICQEVLQSWGGDLQFYQLEGDRYCSRLLLPLAK